MVPERGAEIPSLFRLNDVILSPLGGDQQQGWLGCLLSSRIDMQSRRPRIRGRCRARRELPWRASHWNSVLHERDATPPVLPAMLAVAGTASTRAGRAAAAAASWAPCCRRGRRSRGWCCMRSLFGGGPDLTPEELKSTDATDLSAQDGWPLAPRVIVSRGRRLPGLFVCRAALLISSRADRVR